MRACKKSVRNRVGVHKAEDTSVRASSQIRESNGRVIHRGNSPAGRTWLDRARGDNGPLAGRMTHPDGTPRLADGLGGAMSGHGALRKYPSREAIAARYEYDPISGHLIFRSRPQSDFTRIRLWRWWESKFSGMAAGFDSTGYTYVSLDGVKYPAHRLIYILVHGNIHDDLCIDHIDGNRKNNRIENLRVATRAQNSRNTKMRSSNTSGVTGVYWDASRGKWAAEVKKDRKKIFLGRFDDFEDARRVSVEYRLANGFSGRHAGVAEGEFDTYSLSDYVNAEFRLQMHEAA